MTNLFEAAEFLSPNRPLAERLRPQVVSDVLGQDHILGDDGALGRMIKTEKLSSFVFWGPPGTGKTTLSQILAQHTDMHFEKISAIFSGVADLRKVFAAAKDRFSMGQGTVFFVDEIHRFNKSQQDAFLPYMEDGTIVLIGATTENPSFELNAALLSRCQVVVLNRLDDGALETLITRAEKDGGQELPLTKSARQMLKSMADGDGRYLLNLIEQILMFDSSEEIDEKTLTRILQKRAAIYDKNSEAHYNLMSALHKSVRGSDVNAALYWLSRMFVGGEDPRFIARRVVRMANEDIGLADPQCITQALAALETYERLGSPEGELAIAQAVAYCATAPKSNAIYKGFKEAMKLASETGSHAPPSHILNAPTKMMKDLGYGEGYQYDHDTPLGFSGQNYFPDELPTQELYKPVARGFEREIQKRIAYWKKLSTPSDL